MMMRAIITLMRPEQWVKNLIVFGALIFARRFTNTPDVLHSLLAFGILCLLSSAVYIVNDIHDCEQDSLHPTKKSRPLASGALSPVAARILAVTLILSGMGASFLLPREFLYIVMIFVAFNILYTALLKSIVIIDVMSIAVSFVLRAVAGSYAISVETSPWLIACTFLLGALPRIRQAPPRIDYPQRPGRRTSRLAQEVLSIFSRSTNRRSHRFHRRCLYFLYPFSRNPGEARSSTSRIDHSIRPLRHFPLPLPDPSGRTWRLADAGAADRYADPDQYCLVVSLCDGDILVYRGTTITSSLTVFTRVK